MGRYINKNYPFYFLSLFCRLFPFLSVFNGARSYPPNLAYFNKISKIAYFNYILENVRLSLVRMTNMKRKRFQFGFYAIKGFSIFFFSFLSQNFHPNPVHYCRNLHLFKEFPTSFLIFKSLRNPLSAPRSTNEMAENFFYREVEN